MSLTGGLYSHKQAFRSFHTTKVSQVLNRFKHIMSDSTPALLNEECLNHHIAQQLHLFVFIKDYLNDAFSNNWLPL